MYSTPVVSEESIQEALKALSNPYLGVDLLTAKILKTLIIQENQISIGLRFGYPIARQLTPLRGVIEKLLKPLLG